MLGISTAATSSQRKGALIDAENARPYRVSMRVEPTDHPEIKLIVPTFNEDDRGRFVETYNAPRYAEFGILDVFVQDNWVLTRRQNTVRGLHFQLPPSAQAKLIWVTRGRIFDVAVDLRPHSLSFGRCVTTILGPVPMVQFYIPVGFAHGYCTLEPDSEVVYKTSAAYSPRNERALAWDDPALGIDWPVTPSDALLSLRDRNNPRLAELIGELVWR